MKTFMDMSSVKMISAPCPPSGSPASNPAAPPFPASLVACVADGFSFASRSAPAPALVALHQARRQRRSAMARAASAPRGEQRAECFVLGLVLVLGLAPLRHRRPRVRVMKNVSRSKMASGWIDARL